MSHTLDQLATGDRRRIIAVGGATALRRRLLELGLCGNAEVQVLRRAPMGDPIVIRVRGYELSLRAQEARLIALTDQAA